MCSNTQRLFFSYSRSTFFKTIFPVKKLHIPKSGFCEKNTDFFRIIQSETMLHNFLIFHSFSRPEAYDEPAVFFENTIDLSECYNRIRPEIYRIYRAYLGKRISFEWKFLYIRTAEIYFPGFD